MDQASIETIVREVIALYEWQFRVPREFNDPVRGRGRLVSVFEGSDLTLLGIRIAHRFGKHRIFWGNAKTVTAEEIPLRIYCYNVF